MSETIETIESVPDERPTVEETAESLTGFDEIAIETRFHRSVTDLSATSSMRAMAFILHRRSGIDDQGAYRAVMEATLKDVTDLFREDQGGELDEGKG